MKKLVFLFMIAVSAVTSSCSSDDAAPGDAEFNKLRKTMKTGQWQVASFMLGTENQTADYNGQVFTFKSNNAATLAVSDETYSGQWVVQKTGAVDQDPDLSMTLTYLGPPNVTIINRNKSWEVVEHTETAVTLTLVNDDAVTETLVLEKI